MLLLQAIWWTTLVSRAWFPGGWCGPDGRTVRQQRASSGIQGLLPSTSPFVIIDDGPTWVNFNGMKTPQVSLMGCPDSWWWGFMFGNVYILYRWQTCRVCRLSRFFPSPSLLRQLPENYSAFPDISGRLFLKIHSDGFAAPLQLVFLPFLTKFLMKGLVRWVLPVCYCMEYCPWDSRSHCGEDFNDANLLEVDSALLYIEDMRHVPRIMVDGCGQQKCHLMRFHSGHRNDTSATFQVCPGPQQTSCPDPSWSFFPSNSRHVQWTQGELVFSVVIFLSMVV